jgi:hypothetical protein
LNDTSHAEADYKQTGLTTAYILVDIWNTKHLQDVLNPPRGPVTVYINLNK